MAFTLRPYHSFPVHCAVTYHADDLGFRQPGFNLPGALQLGDEPLRLFAIVRGCRRVRRYSHANVTRVVPTVLPVRSRSLRAPVSFLHSGGSVPKAAARVGSSL